MASFEALSVADKNQALRQATEFPPDQAGQLQLLSEVFAAYQSFDQPDLRAAAERFLLKLARHDFEAVLSKFKTIAASSASVAPSAVLLLLEWTNVLLKVQPQELLVRYQADLLLRSTAVPRKSLRHTAYRQTRALWATLFSQYGIDLPLLQLESKTLASVVLFAAISDAATSIAPHTPAIEAQVRDSLPKFTTAYVATALSNDPALNEYVLDLLESPISLISQSLFEEQLVPAFGRAVLRSAEVSLVNVVPRFISQAPDLDMSPLLEQLKQSLISNLSSSNESVRVAAATVLGLLLQRCSDELLVNHIASVAKKATSSAQRALFATAFANLKTYDSSIVDVLESMAAKESSESAVGPIAKACVNALPETESSVVAGLNSAKLSLCRLWITAYEENAKYTSPKIKSSVDAALAQVTSNVNSAITSKNIAVGYAAIALGAVADELFSEKVYLRVSSPGEILVGLRAAIKRGLDSSARASAYWVASLPHGAIQARGIDLLSAFCKTYPDLGATAVTELSSRITQWKSVLPLMRAFGQPNGSEATLVASVVLAHHPRASAPQGWIDLCLHAKSDLEQLVTKNSTSLLRLIWQYMQFEDDGAADWHKAACDALATLAFISPGTFAPEIVSYIESSLAPISLNSDDLAIFKTTPGELAMTSSVLKKKATATSKKNKSLDAWEEEVRKEIAAKTGGTLSKEDQATVAEQATRRAEISRLVARYELAMLLVTALSRDQVENGKSLWFPVAISKLLALAESKVAVDQAAKCIGDLSTSISPRFAERRAIAGPAICHAFGLPSFASDSTILLLLYRAKMLGDQRPLDTISLAYILPLLIKVVKNTRPKTSEQEEMLLLTLSILASHADELAKLPRQDLIVSLTRLLSTVRDKAKDTKECLRRVSQGVVFDDEELGVLLNATLEEDPYVRASTLEIIDQEIDLSACDYAPEIFVCRFGEHKKVADDIWIESSMKVKDITGTLLSLRPLLGKHARSEVARAITAVVLEHEHALPAALDLCYNTYAKAREAPRPVYDEYGLEVKVNVSDPWQLRSGVVQTLTLLSRLVKDDQVLDLADFVTRSVGDPHDIVDNELRALGEQLVSLHGADRIDDLLPRFEILVSNPVEDANVRQAHVVIYGLEAQHLSRNDDRLPRIMDKLIETLDSTSEHLQRSVGDCLSALAHKVDPSAYITRLSESLLSSTSTSSRRGAGFGIAGFVKGLGLAALSDFDIVRSIQEASDDRKNADKREGAQLAVTCLSNTLGRVFEPYALQLLPMVLVGLGDAAAPVREAANFAARSIMKFTTGYGVKTTIPLALENLEQTAWRGKKGAVELLGSMAFLDPRQLSTSLSVIVPEIVGALNDTHKEIRAAAKGSLRTFGDVIVNPEIKALTPTLLDAISNPTKNTEKALDGLLSTKFVHYIDSPSLALVIHVIKRGLRDRSANTKRRSCQVVGNMSILTDGPDLIPYLPEILPDLQVAMTDPVPSTCATACKALGALVEKLGEDQFPDVIPNMLDILSDPTKVSDRWGCAQGLAEVTHGLGIAKLEELLPVVVRNCSSLQTNVRQGFILLLMFLPASFGPTFTPYLASIVPAILRGLADQVEDVREQALKAGRLIIRDYATKAVDLLLPELEKGLADPSYRIRLSSVELTGDLMYRLAGINKANIEEGTITTANQKVLVEVLGKERRDRVLAALFICRADTAAPVRNSAVEVWKALVFNTPRTVKDILAPLTHILVHRLSDEHSEIQSNAARALGELVRRVSGALTLIMPTLEQLATDPEARHGICVGLVELISATQLEDLRNQERPLTHLIRGCLTDPSSSVREAASQAFDALQETLGGVASDLLPELIAQMQNGDDGALAALKEMMGTSADVVFPVLVPNLVLPPMTPFKATSLADICEVAGDALYRNIDEIVDALLISELQNNDKEVGAALDRVLAVVLPEVHLLEKVKAAESATRSLVLKHLALQLNSQTLEYTQDWTTFAILSLEENSSELIENAVAFLQGLTGSVSKPELAKLSPTAHSALKLTSAPLAGFNVPKGISSVLPFFLQGLSLGSNSEKELSAAAISDVVGRSEEAHLKPVVTQIVGPLIRIVGEKYPAAVKAAIIQTLSVLLAKIPLFLKPFLPQLQRIFAKSLGDADSQLLRARAAKALGTLIPLQTRIDPLAKELITGVRSATQAGVKTAMLQALFEIVSQAGKHLTEPIKESILELISTIEVPSDDIRFQSVMARISAIIYGLMNSPDDVKHVTLSQSLLSVLTVNAVIVYSSELVTQDLIAYLENLTTHANSSLSENAVVGLGKYLLSTDDSEPLAAVISCIESAESRSTDTRRLALVILRAVAAKRRHYLSSGTVDQLAMPLFHSVRDTAIPVKLEAEQAFVDVFDFVHKDAANFDEWFESAKNRGIVPEASQRSLSEYVRRVATRHALARREQALAGLSKEDESEIWQIGLGLRE